MTRPSFVVTGAARKRAQRSRTGRIAGRLLTVDDEPELEIEHFGSPIDHFERGGDALTIVGMDRVEPTVTERVLVREPEQREQARRRRTRHRVRVRIAARQP